MSIVIHVVFAVIVGIVFVHTKILGAFGPVNIKQNYSNLQGEWTSDRATTITFDGDAFRRPTSTTGFRPGTVPGR